MNQNTKAYKNLNEIVHAADATLNGSADGMSVIEAMWIGQICRNVRVKIQNIIEPNHRDLMD